MNIIISNHAFKRWRERNSLSYKVSISKVARQAYAKGETAESYAGTQFEDFLNHTAKKFRADNQFLRVYKNYIFIYGTIGREVLLITVMEIPEEFFYVKDYTILK